ncbi:hypothetical protein DSD19_04720 [Rhodovulum sp. BSW8]|uniref:hypothetical protein n=1 Tax=Rhodovulum sp. BSW8 TaxID=2259645 RepID=UPI000DE2DF95|nr:hypothetical protein [Rhodovulum sp. BSW8]RBO54683.1 hypothetical protein DSD19_04720 [Rhodovulum sp. BSW8]
MSTPELRTLDQVLSLLDGGDFLSGLLEENRNLIQALLTHQREYGGAPKGSLTIKLNYQLDRKCTLQITGDLDVRKPKEPKASTTAWITADGFVTPSNPNQMRMEVRDAGGHRELRTAGSE